MSEKINYIPLESDLAKLRDDLDKLPQALKAALPPFAADIREIWRHWGIKVDAVDSGAFIRDISSFRVNAREFVIGADDTNADYFIELGKASVKGYEPRNPAQKALDQLDQQDDIEKRISDELDRILQK